MYVLYSHCMCVYMCSPMSVCMCMFVWGGEGGACYHMCVYVCVCVCVCVRVHACVCVCVFINVFCLYTLEL